MFRRLLVLLVSVTVRIRGDNIISDIDVDVDDDVDDDVVDNNIDVDGDNDDDDVRLLLRCYCFCRSCFPFWSDGFVSVVGVQGVGHGVGSLLKVC